MMTPDEFEKAVSKNKKYVAQNQIKLTSQQKVDILMAKIRIELSTKAKTITSFPGCLSFTYLIDNGEMFSPFTKEDKSILDDDLSDWCWQLSSLTVEKCEVTKYKRLYIRIETLVTTK